MQENAGQLEEQSKLIPAETDGWKVPDLRPYQQDALQRLLTAKKGTIVAPTGSGKSHISYALIAELGLSAVVIVPTRVLVTQWEKNLKFWAHIHPGVWYSERKERKGLVMVSTYQSLYDRPEFIRDAQVVVFDEGDLSTAAKFSALIEEAMRPEHSYVCLLTATPPQDHIRAQKLQEVLPTVREILPSELLKVGAIAPSEVIKVEVDLTPEELQSYSEMTEKREAIEKLLGVHTPYDVAKIRGGIAPAWATLDEQASHQKRISAAWEYTRLMTKRRKLIAGAENKIPALGPIIDKHPGEMVLVFADLIETLEAAQRYLEHRGIEMRLLTGDTPPRKREDLLDQWGDDFSLLGSAKVIDRGLDVPEVGVLIILGSGSSKVQITQRVGRVLRPSPGKDKALVYVIYCKDTSERGVYYTVRKVLRT